jgi:hypothetical protein
VRHWLKGINKGKTDIFIENLPGGPDNINLAPDGSFWIALVQVILLYELCFYWGNITEWVKFNILVA